MGYRIIDKLLEYNLMPAVHTKAINLCGDENPAHTQENIMMGAQMLSLIEVYPEIKDEFILYLRAKFELPVIVGERGNKLIYETKMKKLSEPATFNYELEVKENGKTVMTSLVHTTNKKEKFELEAKDNLAKIDSSGLEPIADLNITQDMKKCFYQDIIGMSEEEYKKYEEKYESGTIHSIMAPFFIPAYIVGFLKEETKDLNTGKKYFYGSEEVWFYSDKISTKGLKLIGKKPENLAQKSKCHIDLFIAGLEGIVAKSRTLAMARAI